MSIQNAIIIFLAVTVAVLVIVTVVFAARCNYLHSANAAFQEHEKQLSSDKQALLDDKRELINRNAELYSDNVKLSDALRELREINKTLTDPAVTESSEPEPSPVTETFGLLPPDGVHTNMYRCEPYMVYDNESRVYVSAFLSNSHQAMLQEDCYTEPETGIRYYIDNDGHKWYCAALATAYGVEIGRCYMFRLANDTLLPVIVADFKHPITDPRPDDYGDGDTNYDGDFCINVIEFVCDMQIIPGEVWQAGTMSALDRFGGLHGYGGDIVSVVDKERRWNP